MFTIHLLPVDPDGGGGRRKGHFQPITQVSEGLGGLLSDKKLLFFIYFFFMATSAAYRSSQARVQLRCGRHHNSAGSEPQLVATLDP